MRFVQQPALRPHRCAALPYIGASNAKWGFFDFGTDLPYGFPQDQADHVYISVEAAMEMAREIGWAPRHQSEQLKAQLEAEKQENARLGEMIADLEAQLAAIAVLKNGAFKQQGAPGRPPKQKASV